jgi:hypothetical protein
MKLPTKNTSVVVIVLIALFFTASWYTLTKNQSGTQQNITNENITKSEITADEIEVDLLGSGTSQLVLISQTEDKVTLEVREENAVLTTKEFSNGYLRPSSRYSVVQLNLNSSKEYIRWDQTAGPHQTETFFITLHESQLFTIPSADFDKEVWYQPFWTSRDTLAMGDLDGDGLVEIFEFVDELPPDAPRLEDGQIKEITTAAFAEKGMPDNFAEDAWLIISRENEGIGRGRKVIWSIHTVVDSQPPFIRKLTQEEFENSTNRLMDSYYAFMKELPEDEAELASKLVSRTELTKDSTDFNDFVRAFWTLGMLFEEPMEVDI